MSETKENLFKKGFTDSVPIALGYIPMAVALGMTAQKYGMPFSIWQSFNFVLYSGSALGGILNLLNIGTLAVSSYILTFFTINCRYILLALALSQKLDPNMNTFERLIVGFFNTDETFVVAMQQQGKLGSSYLYGLSFFPYFCMMSGVALGFFLTNLMPYSLKSAFGITLYAMFLALIVPPCKSSKASLLVVCISGILSFLLGPQFLTNPTIRKIISSYNIIICALISSGIGAWLFPIKKEGRN